MDKLKFVTLENQDGTYSDPIPLNIDSDNVDVNDKTLTEVLRERVYYFNNVADMKNNNELKNGNFVITLGYYEANDGGGAVYLINDNAIASNEYESLNNGKYANIINKISADSIINFRKYCEMENLNGETYVDWKPAFEKMIEFGFRSIYVPAGIFRISDTLTITVPIKIYGDTPENSTIMLMNSENIRGNSILELIGAHNSCVENICLNAIDSDVGKVLDAGLYIHFSDNVSVDNVLIKRVNGNGLKTLFEKVNNVTRTSYDCKLTKVVTFKCSQNGFWLGGTDTFLSNCIAHHVEGHGFYSTRGNHLMTNCKAYWTGKQGVESTGDGFNFESNQDFSNVSHKMRLFGCEAQECGRYGFTLINTDSCQLIACQSDTNGQYCENITPYGYYLKNNRNLKLIGTVINQGLQGWIKIPLYWDDGKLNDINISAETLQYSGSSKYFDKLFEIKNYNGTNKLVINNENCLDETYSNELFKYYQTDTPDGFTMEGHQNFIRNICEPDFFEQCTAVGIEYDTTQSVNINNKIYKELTFDVSKFNKASLSYEGKVSTVNVKGFGRLRFYDEDNNELSQFNLPIIPYSDPLNKSLHWNSVGGNTDIPENCRKIRIEFYIIKSTQDISGTDYAYFKNVKVHFYNEE